MASPPTRSSPRLAARRARSVSQQHSNGTGCTLRFSHRLCAQRARCNSVSVQRTRGGTQCANPAIAKAPRQPWQARLRDAVEAAVERQCSVMRLIQARAAGRQLHQGTRYEDISGNPYFGYMPESGYLMSDMKGSGRKNKIPKSILDKAFQDSLTNEASNTKGSYPGIVCAYLAHQQFLWQTSGGREGHKFVPPCCCPPCQAERRGRTPRVPSSCYYTEAFEQM
jgi:hypothetical protein